MLKEEEKNSGPLKERNEEKTDDADSAERSWLANAALFFLELVKIAVLAGITILISMILHNIFALVAILVVAIVIMFFAMSRLKKKKLSLWMTKERLYFWSHQIEL